jgi:hypothetical protein
MEIKYRIFYFHIKQNVILNDSNAPNALVNVKGNIMNKENTPESKDCKYLICIDGKLIDELCPTAEYCTCGGILKLEYGFCQYGLGAFERCVDCLKVFNFCEDTYT